MISAHSDHPYPRVGVGVLIQKDGLLLFGHRHGSHGADSWGPPGGKLELGESWQACARREALEETGIRIKNIRFLTATNDLFPAENLHYVTIIVLSDWAGSEAKILEPDKCLEWGWFTYQSLPGPLFRSIQNLKKLYPSALPQT